MSQDCGLISTPLERQLMPVLRFSSETTVSFSRDRTIIVEGRRSKKEALCHLNIQAEEHNSRTELN